MAKAPLVRLAIAVLIGVTVLSAGATAASLQPAGGLSATATRAVSRLPGVFYGYRVTRLRPVVVRAIPGYRLRLIPWQGRHVTVLVRPGVRRSAFVMSAIVRALDRCWEYYATVAGRLPAPYLSLHGRDEIAEVPRLPGAAARTYLGATGTNIQTPYFDQLYDDAADRHQFDQALFYELGRSFWFWSGQLQFGPDLEAATGYAVLMRWESMSTQHIPGGPVLDPAGSGTNVPFSRARSDMIALVGYYDAHPSLTFGDTLAVNRSPAPGVLQGTDFWASIMWHLAARHGGRLFLRRFFDHAFRLPKERTVGQAVANWANDASYAACVNLRPLFYRRWGFPRPDGQITPRPAASVVREPPGSCAHRR